MNRKLTVLFVCTGNSCRSQMAEGWTRHLKSDRISPFSAGILPSRLDPLAVEVMAEAGVDISRQDVHKVSDFFAHDLDYVVTVCSGAHEHCPTFPQKVRIVAHGFDDPPALTRGMTGKEEKLAVYRRVRDEVKAFIETLPGVLSDQTPQPAQAQTEPRR